MNKDELNKLELIEMNEMSILHRKGTTDFNCLKEVLQQKCYKSVKYKFDVQEGEKWLDLGGNIGAFGLYVMNNGGTILSYEPDEDCFEIMKMNYENNFDDSKWSIENCAISNKRQATLKFYKGGKDTDRYRTSLIPNTKDTIVLKNTHCSYIKDMKFDGIKMDIEGAEFGLIDEDLLPECDKLVMEYHLTKDKSMENFHKRMNKLRERFSEVLYMPSLDKEYPNGIYPGFFDRIIICKK